MSDAPTEPEVTGTDDAATGELPAQPIAARAGSYFRRMRYAFTVAMLAMGVFFLYDGFKGYPGHNAKVDALTAKVEEAKQAGRPDDAKAAEVERSKLKAKYSDLDILLQRVLGFVLIPGSALALWRWLHMSRGEYRLEADTVHAPGHPPVPLVRFTALDDALWDKKGIATADYELPDGTEGTMKLDDFVYERDGIDGIHDHIRKSIDARTEKA